MSNTATKKKMAAPAPQPVATERFQLVGERCFRDAQRLHLRADGVWCFREFTFSSDKRYAHADRASFLKDANLGDGWEIAKTPELVALYDYQADKLHPELAGRIKAEWHWASEDPASSSVLAWFVSFDSGSVHWLHRDGSGFVVGSRLVPAGQF